MESFRLKRKAYRERDRNKKIKINKGGKSDRETGLINKIIERLNKWWRKKGGGRERENDVKGAIEQWRVRKTDRQVQ